ncbi:MAG: hypothetical protein KME16_18100 [Scytolyngbya sp. HA4215-MV1]|jgi:hypothetical protein|nr:hypothetical protein [Scytolyngbya sp. HA4215-MV1]
MSARLKTVSATFCEIFHMKRTILWSLASLAASLSKDIVTPDSDRKTNQNRQKC